VQFKFFGPLKSIAGEGLEIELEHPATLRDLLSALPERLHRLIPYGEKTTDAQLLANLSFFKDNQMMRIDDPIETDDTILVLLPPTGG
jgi:hypothetical protein